MATINISLPSKYATEKSQNEAPALDWLERTWSVTHSTLAMWRSARNVRISYAKLPPAADGAARVDDLVEYEPLNKSGVLKSVKGVDTQAAGGGDRSWDWRGKGWLFFVSSHWEIIAWGEEARPDGVTERWAVTWFAPTVFTKEGLDIYCDQREGLSEDTYGRIMESLRGLKADSLVKMVEADMKLVEIKLPWTEKKSA